MKICTFRSIKHFFRPIYPSYTAPIKRYISIYNDYNLISKIKNSKIGITVLFRLLQKSILPICSLFLISFSTTSCVENSTKYKELQEQLDSLQGNYGIQKNQLDNIFAALNEVEAGLENIREKENIITVETSKEGEYTESQKDKIEKNIAAIQTAINQYKAKIEELKNDKNIKSVEFKKRLNAIQKELDAKSQTINKLQSEIEAKDVIIKEKDEQISSMDSTITGLQKNLEELNDQSQQMKQTIVAQDKKLNSAYYIVGTKDELIKIGVLEKGNLFKSAKISYQAEKSAFIKIDYREITTINTNSPSAKILSNHPKETYTITNIDGEAIVTITDVDKFWEHTKYLVIQAQ